jgi:hypothetical protein
MGLDIGKSNYFRESLGVAGETNKKYRLIPDFLWGLAFPLTTGWTAQQFWQAGLGNKCREIMA